MLSNTYAIVTALCTIAQDRRDCRHGLDTNDTLDGKVSLVGQRSCEIICADLIGWNERIGDQELRPLIEQSGLGGA